MTNYQKGGRATIAGAGVAGLAAGAAVSPMFDEVVIFEKDSLPDEPVARRGVAQGQHVHVFLAGGLASLGLLLPNIAEDFRAAGAERVDLGQVEFFDHGSVRPHRALGLEMHCLSRPQYEQVIRRRVMAMGNVEIRQNCRVDGIDLDGHAATGLRLRSGGIEHADLVVDASGRGASLARELVENGYGRAPEVEIGIAMCYASARFKLSDRWRGATAAMCVPVPPDKRYGVLLPIENGECIVSLGGRGGVEPEAEFEPFLDYARQLACSAIYERLRDARLLSPIRRYQKPTANWRRYEQMERFPERLAPVGDTIASFNPTWGQGMTVAVRVLSD